MQSTVAIVATIVFALAPTPGRTADHGLDYAEPIGPFLNHVFPSEAPGPAGNWVVKRVFPNLNVDLPTFAGPYPGTNKLLFVEKDGRILMFENTPNVSQGDVFLDIRSRTYSNSDSGMTYFAFHPEFGEPGSPNRGYVYVTYKYSPNGDSGDLSYWRLSRFNVPDGQLAADPDSEQILIQQFDRQQWHDSGCLMFGPDGFLYIGIGDEGGANDQYNDSQKINDRLFSGILRIDVDKNPARSHPIRRQPQRHPSQPAGWPDSFTANYYIPNDNPFVNPDGSVLEEFYAIGLRNPYRFAYDPATGEIWCGDVGQDTREEVNHIVAGGNYGWAFREGFAPGPKSPPSTIIGTFTEPLWDYNRILGSCVIGGYFYYGSEHPSLRGKYIIVDNTSGRIWALSRNSPTTASAEYLTSMPSGGVYSGTSTCLQMPNGEIYFVKLGSGTKGEIYKLARSGTAVPEPPALLSQTDAFADLATLTPAPGIIPYTVNAPLWSDAALKRRWIAIPNDGNPDSPSEKIAFAPESEWDFPTGTVFIKHFELANDENNPNSVRRLETRFLVISENGEPYGVTYRWRPDGSDADLLSDGQEEAISIALQGGGTREQVWSYPSRANCMLCHNSNAKYVLGVNTHQLNGDLTYPKTGRTANQLATLAHLGFFDDAYHPEHLDYLLKSRNLIEVTAPLETRVRSYIDSNCAQCHRPGGVRAFFDARFVTPLQNQNLIWGKVESQFTGDPEAIIYPADPVHSILYRRDAIVGPRQMPPLGKNMVDTEWVTELENWIQGLGTGPGVELILDEFEQSGAAWIDVVFTHSVTGLTLDDFYIRGGTLDQLTGSGAEYRLKVTPTSKGKVRVELPQGRAFADGGLPNYASNKLAIDPQEPSLATWLKLDESAGTVAHDSSTGNNDGAITNITNNNWIANGKFDGALHFDNSGSRITLANVLGHDFTISFWLRTTQNFPVTDNPISGVPLFWSDASGPTNDFSVSGTSSGNGISRISFLTGHQSGAANVHLHGSKAVNTGQWTHIAIRRVQSTGSMQIYVNGAIDGNMAGSTSTLTANPQIEIGSSNGSNLQLVGDLDQIRFYTRALSASEIAALAQESPAVDSPVDSWFAKHLPGLFHLHELYLDPDGDSRDNASEFALNTDPLAFDSAPTEVHFAVDGSAEIGFPVRADAQHTSYNVLVSDDLKTWQPAGARLTNIHDITTADPDYLWRTMDFTPQPGDNSDRIFIQIEATGVSEE